MKTFLLNFFITFALTISINSATISINTTGDDTTGDGSILNPFATIQRGVDIAISGDTISIGAGIYSGVGNTNIDIGINEIIIEGENSTDSVVIDCENSSNGFYDLTVGTHTKIYNLSIINADTAIVVGLSNISLYSVNFRNCTTSISKTVDGYDLTIIGCNFLGNVTAVESRSNFYIDSCFFDSNTTAIEQIMEPFEYIIKNSMFSNNINAINYFDGNSGYHMQIDSCDFIDNTNHANGSFNINNSHFSGGSKGIDAYKYYGLTSSINITNSTFDNISDTVIICGRYTSTISNCSITNSGIPVYLNILSESATPSVSISSSTIENNTGGMYLSGNELNLSINGNTYINNGHIYAYSSGGPYGAISFNSNTITDILNNDGISLNNREGSININNNILKNTGKLYSSLGNVFESGGIFINGNLFDNLNTNYQTCIEITASNKTEFINNTIINCLYDSSIVLLNIDSTLINNNIFAFNSSVNDNNSVVKRGTNNSTFDFSCNNLYSNISDEWVGDLTGFGSTNNNISLDPKFCDTTNNDYKIYDSSPCASTNNSCSTLIGAYGIGCGYEGPVWYIDTSGNDITGDGSALNPFATIQKGIDLALDGDSVIVASGIYTGVGNKNINLLGKSITVQSQWGADSTIIDIIDSLQDGFYMGGALNDTNSVINGFTIKNAKNGVFLGASTAKLENMIIDSCIAAVDVSSTNAPFIINNSTISNNNSGIISNDITSVSIMNCTFINNTTAIMCPYIASYDNNNYISIIDCQFYGNVKCIDANGLTSENNCQIENGIFINNDIVAWGAFDFNNSQVNGGINGFSGDMGGYVWGSKYKVRNSNIQNLTGTVFETVGRTTIDSCIINNNNEIVIGYNHSIERSLYLSINNSQMSNNSGGITNSIIVDAIHISNCLYTNNGKPFDFSGTIGNIFINNNTFTNNYSDAIKISFPDYFSSSIAISNNIFARNNGFSINNNIIGISDSSFVTFFCNNIYDNLLDTIIYNELNNISLAPRFCDTSLGDYSLAMNSPCAQTNNSCGTLIGAFDVACDTIVKIWYVDTAGNDTTGDGSALNPFATIQRGIDASIDRDTVLVSSGIYTGSGNWNMDFYGKEVVLKSISGRDSTTIITNASGDDVYNRGFNFTSSENEFTVVDGFTLIPSAIPNGFGVYAGAISIANASPTLKNLVISNYRISGALGCVNGSPRIENCVFSTNTSGCSACKVVGTSSNYTSGAAVSLSNSNPIIKDCTFSSNVSEDVPGGAIACFDSSPVITNCEFIENMAAHADGGAIYLSNSNAQIVSCEFNNNTSIYENGGAIAVNNSSPIIDSCLFRSNWLNGGYGGAIYSATQSFPIIRNSNFINNYADVNDPFTSFNGAGIYSTDFSNPAIENSIFISNSYGGAIVSSGPDSDPIISCSNFYNNFGDSLLSTVINALNDLSNFSLDPLFCGTANNAYTLRSDSPCLQENNNCNELIGAYGLGCSCCVVDRGNVNGGLDNGTLVGSVDITDLVFLVAFMFQGGGTPPCIEEADINGSGGDPSVDISDLVALVAYMFQGGLAPAECPY